MTTLEKAAQQALEAMEEAHNLLPGMYDKHLVGIKQRHFNAITALRSALAQQEQAKPVAWMTPRKDIITCNGAGTRFNDWIPLYTHPPRREWRELSNGEIYTAYITATNQTLRPQDERLALAFARAIEQALKEKNQ